MKLQPKGISGVSDCVTRAKGLVTNYGEGGGGYKTNGGGCEVLPLRKGVGWKQF